MRPNNRIIRIIVTVVAILLALVPICTILVYAEPTSDVDDVLLIDEEEATLLAKTMYGEYNNTDNYNQCAAVCWCVLNRVDAPGFGNTVKDVVTAYKQFHGYRAKNPVVDELYQIAVDVLTQYALEKAGAEDVNRVLPKEFVYFSGNGKVNTYRDQYKRSLAHLLVP